MATRPPLNCPTYPYFKVVTGANTMKGMEYIPYKILTYLLDLPDTDYGYTPPDDNDYPRCRLMKYLYYDCANPLDEELPSKAQKLSLLFDPRHPDINSDLGVAAHPKGYRLFMQRMIKQSELEAKTILKCYIDKISEHRKFVDTIGIMFEIWTDVNLETNTKSVAYDRTIDIEQCLHDALDGVDIAGVGTFSFSRYDHSYNGSEELWTDGSFVGRSVHFSVDWAENSVEETETYN